MAMLNNGENVPDFTLKTTTGEDFTLSSEMKGITILSFIRGEW
jgi:peroxiredoxin